MTLSKECFGPDGKCSLFLSFPSILREKEENILFSRNKELEPAKGIFSIRKSLQWAY